MFLIIKFCNIMVTLQKDEMEVEHLATLERLRQSQRQDYLKVCTGVRLSEFIECKVIE